MVVLHDLNLASRYASHLIAMRDGAIVAAGAPDVVIDAESVRDVFGLDSVVIDDPVSHTPLVIPVGSHHGSRRDTRRESDTTDDGVTLIEHA